MTTVLLLLLPLAATPAPVDVADRKQLFVDGRFIAARDRVELRAKPPVKLGPLRDERGDPLRGHVSRVLEDGGKVRLYLGAEDVEVLEGDDGLRVRRTGVRLPRGVFPTVFLDPHEADPARRYKLFRVKSGQPVRPRRGRRVR